MDKKIISPPRRSFTERHTFPVLRWHGILLLSSHIILTLDFHWRTHFSWAIAFASFSCFSARAFASEWCLNYAFDNLLFAVGISNYVQLGQRWSLTIKVAVVVVIWSWHGSEFSLFSFNKTYEPIDYNNNYAHCTHYQRQEQQQQNLTNAEPDTSFSFLLAEYIVINDKNTKTRKFELFTWNLRSAESRVIINNNKKKIWIHGSYVQQDPPPPPLFSFGRWIHHRPPPQIPLPLRSPERQSCTCPGCLTYKKERSTGWFFSLVPSILESSKYRKVNLS